MSKEELLMSRYEVIADYPNSPCEMGEIIIVFETVKECENYEGGENVFIKSYMDFDKYKDVFRPLHWSSYRSITDLPQYIMQTITNKIYKVDWRHFSGFTFPMLREKEESTSILIWKSDRNYYAPSTLAEYTAFKATQP